MQVTEVRKRVLGREHPDTLSGMFNLARAYHLQGKKHMAIELQTEVVRGFEVAIGFDHPNTKDAKETLHIILSK